MPVHGDEAAVGDGDAMSVAGELGQLGLRATEGAFGIDDPVGPAQRHHTYRYLSGVLLMRRETTYPSTIDRRAIGTWLCHRTMSHPTASGATAAVRLVDQADP